MENTGAMPIIFAHCAMVDLTRWKIVSIYAGDTTS
jgi:hypothetical protein